MWIGGADCTGPCIGIVQLDIIELGMSDSKRETSSRKSHIASCAGASLRAAGETELGPAKRVCVSPDFSKDEVRRAGGSCQEMNATSKPEVVPIAIGLQQDVPENLGSVVAVAA